MKRKRILIRATLSIGLAAFAVYAALDPTAAQQPFEEFLRTGVRDAGFSIVEIASSVSSRSREANRIPAWIRWHPRRLFSPEWKEAHVGLTPRTLTRSYTIEKGSQRLVILVNQIKLRVCSVDLYEAAEPQADALKLGAAIRAQYRYLPVTVHRPADVPPSMRP